MSDYIIEKYTGPNTDTTTGSKDSRHVHSADGIPFTQSHTYGRWQEHMGRKVVNYVIRNTANNSIALYCQIITYSLVLGRSYLYIPYGPLLLEPLNVEFNNKIREILTEEMRAQRAVFARLDFTQSFEIDGINEMTDKFGYRLAPKVSTHSAYFQPRSEWILDLAPTEDELLAKMHEKTRYSIRLGYRKGITHEIVSADSSKAHMAYFDEFYKLMLDTATRNKFRLHQKNYYEIVFASLSDYQPGQAFLSIARYSGIIMAIDLVIIHCGVAYYLYGGSSPTERNRMPTYVAMWEAIKHSKTLGAKSYNFGAISKIPPSNPAATKTSWSGITDYKMKFGGRILNHGPLLDIISSNIMDKALYHLYNIRKYLQKKLR